MNKHTPGPWKVDGSGMDIFSNDGAGSLLATTTCCHANIAELEANANLIAAAPELLEALDDVVRYMTELKDAYINQWGENSYTVKAHNSGAKALSVIAKARGEY